MHAFLGSLVGRRDLYAPTAGIVWFAPEWEPVQRSKTNKHFPEDGIPLEKFSAPPGVVLALMVRHLYGLRDLNCTCGIMC